MSDDQIRIAIAEICALSWSHADELAKTMDYPNDLNACYEFEKVIKEQERLELYKCLARVVNEDTAGAEVDMFDVCSPLEIRSIVMSASARQRCEAFLRLHGKWIEEKQEDKHDAK
jgi:hypothetical protein